MANHENELDLIEDAALLIDDSTIFWCGPQKELPQVMVHNIIDAEKKVVMPGLIDCHTHLIFASKRAEEFSWRMSGESYQSIMAKGGGIQSTVSATRKASHQQLFDSAHAYLTSMLHKGVTTIEAKSGYGLSSTHELAMLRILKELNASHAVDISATFLGAHVIPSEYKANAQSYVDAIINEMLPQIAHEKLAVDCDVFCEKGAFSIEQTRTIFKKACDLGFGLRAHLEQLSYQGSAQLLLDFPIKSISHGDFLRADDIKIIAMHNCIVELVPIAALFLRAQQLPPVHELVNSHVKLAIATDFNPGSAMCNDLILAARLAVTLMEVAPANALKAITVHAALSLGFTDRGVIAPGKKADILLTHCHDWNEIFYDWTMHPARLTIKNGQLTN